MSLINITSTVPDVTVVLNVSSATKADTGYYSCMTLPPDTISPEVLIEISGKIHVSRDSTVLLNDTLILLLLLWQVLLDRVTFT